MVEQIGNHGTRLGSNSRFEQSKEVSKAGCLCPPGFLLSEMWIMILQQVLLLGVAISIS